MITNPNEFGSVATGSPTNAPAINSGNQGSPAGQAQDGGQTDYKALYEELEKKFGAQGNEVGEYRTFFNSISPLLDKLDQSPEIVQAILDGKIDKNLAQAAYEGKISFTDAAVVSQAATEVKQDLGKDYKGTSPEELSKLVEQKMNEVRRELEESAELKDFEARSQKFIESTPDFVDHADKIDKWLDEHDVTDIEIAYYAVKGQMSEVAAKKAAEVAAAERAKEVFQNAQGGGVSAQYSPDGGKLVDSLIASRSNPNVF